MKVLHTLNIFRTDTLAVNIKTSSATRDESDWKLFGPQQSPPPPTILHSFAHRDNWYRSSSGCYGYAVGPPAAWPAPGVKDYQRRGQSYLVGRSRSRSVQFCNGCNNCYNLSKRRRRGREAVVHRSNVVFSHPN